MPTKSNILLVLNPKAGSIDSDLVLSKMTEITSKHSLTFETYKTTGENDQEQLSKMLKSSNFSRIIAAGGDGTINMVASIIVNSEISLGILACGSANGLAKNLGIQNNLEHQIRSAIGTKTEEMDVIMVNDKLCMHIAGLGLNAELIRNYDNSKIHGKLGYLLNTIPTLFKSEYPYNFELIRKGKSTNHKGILFALANAAEYGSGAKINPDAKLNDGKFEIVIFKKLNIIKILKTFSSRPRVRSEYAETFSLTSVEVNCSKSLALQIDGEFMGMTKKVKAHILNKALKLAVMQNA